MRAYSPHELEARLGATALQPLLVDVREPWEYEICRLEGSVNVPLAQIPARADELPRDREIVMICHHGMRSYQAGQYLLRAGFAQVVNLDGGIDAWAALVERDMPRY